MRCVACCALGLTLLLVACEDRAGAVVDAGGGIVAGDEDGGERESDSEASGDGSAADEVDVDDGDGDLSGDGEVSRDDDVSDDAGRSDASQGAGDAGLGAQDDDGATSIDGDLPVVDAGFGDADVVIDGGPGDGAAAADACADACTSGPAFVPVRFSRVDRSACALVSDTGLELEFVDWGPCGARSDTAIAPGSGVFYFEGHRLAGKYKGGGLGIATAAAALTESAGASAQSAGAFATGQVVSAGGSCSGAVDPFLPDLGFVIDYRGATPLLHVVQASPGSEPTLRASCGMSVGAPVYVFYSGDRAKVGAELRVNTGADTTNFPFSFSADQLRAALSAAGHADAGAALVLGFGTTHAAPLDQPPVLDVGPDVSVALGQSVALAASALDPEEGALDAQIEWLDLASPHHAPVRGTGPSFSFTPSSIGVHPIVVSVRDRVGVRAERTLRVTVTGALPQFAPVRLVADALTGPGITLSPDGLSASFNGSSKDGIRANQGLYGAFWYFEVHRDSAIRNMGMGLVTAEGALNPYEPARVPWSCSLNVLRGFWINLIDAGDWAREPTDADYGFAVDYRGEHPRVHILIRGALQTTLELTDVWVPLYPMLYGNPPDAPVAGSDLTINFGARPFVFDPRAILTAAGVDASALSLGWGSAVQP